MSIALIDYGAGNLASVRKAFAAVGADTFSPTAPGALDGADAIVVPGVGHFAATAILGNAWRDTIRRRVEAGVPLFGICLGMQWLFDGSDEAPGVPGLGLLAGTCHRIAAARPLKVPHVGWNTLARARASTLLENVGDGAYVYFTHTFAVPLTPACAASTTHGETFAAVVEGDGIYGVQFHPEKSSDAGRQILTNFVRLVKG